MIQSYRCLDCQHPLTSKNHQGNLWFSCKNCNANYLKVEGFREILSEFEFNKLNHELKFGKMLSSKDCPSCKSRMLLILDLVRINQVEACKKCRMVWMNAGEGAKIKKDQNIDSNSDHKVKVNLQTSIFPDYMNEAYQNRPVYNVESMISKAVFFSIVRFFGLEDLSKTYPLLAFFLLVVVFIAFVYLVFYITLVMHI